MIWRKIRKISISAKKTSGRLQFAAPKDFGTFLAGIFCFSNCVNMSLIVNAVVEQASVVPVSC